MLGKLLKYEFKASGRLIPIVYLVVVMLGIVGAVMAAAELYVYVFISFILLFLAGAAAFIITYVVIFLRFNKGMFGPEGYLAMTLPVTPTQLYLSKTIVAACWLILSGIVMVFAWSAAFGSLFGVTFRELMELPAYAMQEIYETLDRFFSPVAVLVSLLASIIGYLSFVARVFFCVTLSNVRPFQRLGIGAAIIAFVALQIATQVFSVVLSRAVSLSVYFDPYSGWSFSNYHGGSSLFYNSLYSPDGFTISLGAQILPILFAFVLPIFTIRLIEQKVNIK